MERAGAAEKAHRDPEIDAAVQLRIDEGVAGHGIGMGTEKMVVWLPQSPIFCAALALRPREHPHLDHGYAVTSHSAQGQTADWVLIHVDTELAARDLLNNRMAYVAVSRGEHDAQIFTSDRAKLPQALGRDVSHESAHVPECIEVQAARAPEREVERIYTPAEHERHWGPLTRAVPPGEAERFYWLGETGTVQSYQHAETGRNLHIDEATGQFISQDRKPVSRDAALAHAFPDGNRYQAEIERQTAVQRSREQHRQEIGMGYGLGR